jgi:carbamoyltransferase
MAAEVILGIGGYTADASVCLVVDGEVVVALEEERFTRRKHQGGFPKLAIARALRDAGVKKRDIDHITFSYQPWLRASRRVPYRVRQMVARPLVNSFLIFNEARFIGEFMVRLRRLSRETGAKLHFVRHHMAHAASAFLSSPYTEAAIYTIDLVGEWDTTLSAAGSGSRIRMLTRTHYPHSLGIFYTGVTRHLGFDTNDEYKVMGLAAYGEPKYAAELRQVVHPIGKDKFALDLSYLSHQQTQGMFQRQFFTDKFTALFGPPRDEEAPIDRHHMDLAASAQLVFEECVFHQLRALHERTGSDVVTVAGGCGLNGVMCGRIPKHTSFRHVFVPSVAGDNGLSLGGALYVRHQLLGAPRGAPLLRADLGTSYGNDEIAEMLELFKLPHTSYDDIIEPTVELLLEGAIVGWFQGRMEFGARALGNRSILANPTLPDMKDRINKYVKFREEFRPFAPSVLEEAAARFFDVRDPIPFMTSVADVIELGRERLPATTHVDNTARPQTVSRAHAPLYYRLIEAFGKRTGVPVLLNTSFNVMGEPIVEHPRHAVRCFFSCGMDALVIGNHVLRKSEALERWTGTARQAHAGTATTKVDA